MNKPCASDDNTPTHTQHPPTRPPPPTSPARPNTTTSRPSKSLTAPTSLPLTRLALPRPPRHLPIHTPHKHLCVRRQPSPTGCEGYGEDAVGLEEGWRGSKVETGDKVGGFCVLLWERRDRAGWRVAGGIAGFMSGLIDVYARRRRASCWGSAATMGGGE